MLFHKYESLHTPTAVFPPSGVNCMAAISSQVAADCTYTAGKLKLALKNIKSKWYQVSGVYESNFNIQLAIIELKIMQSCGDGEDVAGDYLCQLDLHQQKFNLQCQSLSTSGFKTVGPCPGQDDAV
ncbi:hypothetical protein HDU92_000218 [Lobulomyces angularis]|nr:hypothetical protein HDU92_000218 [Lobulomyces angularis]